MSESGPRPACRRTARAPASELPYVTPAQRRLLDVLCRDAVPPSNREIAAELGISLDTVKGTLSVLFERCGLEALPQNAKRAALAARSGFAEEWSVRPMWCSPPVLGPHALAMRPSGP